MSQLLDPITNRDFSAGRITKATVATALMPVNSVANAINVDFSEVVGSGIVRKGKNRIQNITSNMLDGQAERISTSGTNKKVYLNNLVAQTFTPTSSQNFLQAIAIKIQLIGLAVGNIIVSLQTTSSGHPTGTLVQSNRWVFPAGQIAASASVATVFPATPGTFLNTGQVYAIVIEYDGGDAIDNYLEWIYNSGTSYAGGFVQTSTDNGATWTNTTGALYFAQEITDPAAGYNFAPLGNYSFLANNLKKNVVGFEVNDQGTTFGTIYYYEVSQADWHVSNIFNQGFNPFSPTAKIRFANMNGYVYEVNGVNSMKSSVDFGQTWTTTNCIFPFDLSAAQAWIASINYPINALVFFGSSFYTSLIDNNLNQNPLSSPSDWEPLTPIIPSLIIVAGNRLLVGNISGGPLQSGSNNYPSRIYFSSLVDPAAPSGLTWSTDPTSGDFIDIDPDSGGVLTGFANTSSLTLVFKNNAFYRLNAINKTITAENIYNVGAVSQEAITQCLGLTYFYSGQGIYQTDGTFPQPISRIGVQDFVDAITTASGVYAWNDGYNVYFSIGAVTMQFGPEDTRTYSNVVLKFSPRDQNWQVYSYDQRLAQGSLFGVQPTVIILVTEYNGDIAQVNSETIGDDGHAIPYDLETQELELGNRSHTKDISDQIVIFTRNGNEGAFSVKANDGDFVSANVTLEERVNVADNVDFKGEFFTFKWRGEALGSRPMFEGYHLPKVTDEGISKNGQP